MIYFVLMSDLSPEQQEYLSKIKAQLVKEEHEVNPSVQNYGNSDIVRAAEGDIRERQLVDPKFLDPTIGKPDHTPTAEERAKIIEEAKLLYDQLRQAILEDTQASKIGRRNEGRTPDETNNYQVKLGNGLNDGFEELEIEFYQVIRLPHKAYTVAASPKSQVTFSADGSPVLEPRPEDAKPLVMTMPARETSSETGSIYFRYLRKLDLPNMSESYRVLAVHTHINSDGEMTISRRNMFGGFEPWKDIKAKDSAGIYANIPGYYTLDKTDALGKNPQEDVYSGSTVDAFKLAKGKAQSYLERGNPIGGNSSPTAGK